MEYSFIYYCKGCYTLNVQKLSKVWEYRDIQNQLIDKIKEEVIGCRTCGCDKVNLEMRAMCKTHNVNNFLHTIKEDHLEAISITCQ